MVSAALLLSFSIPAAADTDITFDDSASYSISVPEYEKPVIETENFQGNESSTSSGQMEEESADTGGAFLDDAEPISFSVPDYEEPEISSASFQNSSDISYDMPAQKLTHLSGSLLAIDGTEVYAYVGYALHFTLEEGFQAPAQPDVETETLDSRVVSDPFTLTLGNCSLTVRVVNPYEKPAPLSECILASAACEDAGVIYGRFLDTAEIGKTTRDEFDEEYLQSAYQNESSTEGSTLVFKTSPSHILLNYDTSEPYGRQIMWDEDYSIDLQLDFGQDGTVSAITMRSPAFLYNSLENNISSEQLSSMSSTEVQSAASLRDDILGNLASAFENAVVNVNIDQQSGVIRLDNEVLFDVDSYELSDAGKAYLDSFISVYASALLDGSFAEQINHIEIAGHTDTNDTWEHNQVLSENRAKAVYDYCISSVNNGMDDTQKAAFAELTEEKGYSYSDPIFTDTGEIDMAASRRVEIRFFINV